MVGTRWLLLGGWASGCRTFAAWPGMRSDHKVSRALTWT